MYVVPEEAIEPEDLPADVPLVDPLALLPLDVPPLVAPLDEPPPLADDPELDEPEPMRAFVSTYRSVADDDPDVPAVSMPTRTKALNTTSRRD